MIYLCNKINTNRTMTDQRENGSIKYYRNYIKSILCYAGLMPLYISKFK